MQNAENEKQVLHENAANFYNWICEARKRQAEEDSELKTNQAKLQNEQNIDKAA